MIRVNARANATTYHRAQRTRPAVSIEPYAAATHRYALNTIRASDDEANAADAADDDGADGALKGDRATVNEMRHLLPCMQMCAPQAYRLM